MPLVRLYTAEFWLLCSLKGFGGRAAALSSSPRPTSTDALVSGALLVHKTARRRLLRAKAPERSPRPAGITRREGEPRGRPPTRGMTYVAPHTRRAANQAPPRDDFLNSSTLSSSRTTSPGPKLVARSTATSLLVSSCAVPFRRATTPTTAAVRAPRKRSSVDWRMADGPVPPTHCTRTPPTPDNRADCTGDEPNDEDTDRPAASGRGAAQWATRRTYVLRLHRYGLRSGRSHASRSRRLLPWCTTPCKHACELLWRARYYLHPSGRIGRRCVCSFSGRRGENTDGFGHACVFFLRCHALVSALRARCLGSFSKASTYDHNHATFYTYSMLKRRPRRAGWRPAGAGQFAHNTAATHAHAAFFGRTAPSRKRSRRAAERSSAAAMAAAASLGTRAVGPAPSAATAPWQGASGRRVLRL